jgi:hydroxymethylglutaryl-CoA lyase
MMSAEKIFINDVGPRDGLQNQPKILSTDERKQLVDALVKARVPAIEVGAFVSPKAVPAMAGTDMLIADLAVNGALYSALIPNLKGYQLASVCDTPVMSLVVAASNTMNEKNIRMDTTQSMQVCFDVLAQAKQDKRNVQAYVATAWVCPFEGKVDPTEVMRLSEQLLDAGASGIVVADTIGAAHPQQVKSLMANMVAAFGHEKLACHFHDTRAMGLADVYAAIDAGIRKFDASIAGLGGCPFAPGASGNVATEDVVMMVEQMGFNTGIDMAELLNASDLAIALTGTAKGGKAKSWIEKYYNQTASPVGTNNQSGSQK